MMWRSRGNLRTVRAVFKMAGIMAYFSPSFFPSILLFQAGCIELRFRKLSIDPVFIFFSSL